jgi:hypothetical protein
MPTYGLRVIKDRVPKVTHPSDTPIWGHIIDPVPICACLVGTYMRARFIIKKES